MGGFPAMRNGTMLCPICGFDYTRVWVGRSIDDGEYPDTGYPDFRPRGGAFALEGACENGCSFEILVGFHKGTTQVATYGKSATDRACEGLQFDSEVERQFWLAYVKAVDCFTNAGDYLNGLVPQYGVGSYRLDFAIPDIKFAIEIDGLAYHNGQDSFMRDRKRQRDLEADGWRVIRFAAKEVMNDPWQCVMESATQAARVRQS